MTTADADRQTTSLEGLRVLLAEDEIMIALNITTEFERYGAEVTLIDSVEDGFRLPEDAFDVALLDVRLADGDVYPLAERLNRVGVNLVFHTGHEDVGRLRERFPGALAFSKPVTTALLVDGISRAADGA